jgi:cytochrome c553
MKPLMLGLALSLTLIGCSQNEPAKQKQPAADLAAGKALAERECKSCHGLDGKGTVPAIPNLAGQSERYLVASLAEYRDGKRSHAALRDLSTRMSDADARNVAAYYAGLPPVGSEGGGAPLVSPYDAGRKAAAPCASCHGEDGNSKTAGTPSLAGQQPGYFVTAIREYLSGARPTAPMHMLVRDTGRLDLENIALYFASQQPAERSAPPFGDAAAGEPLTAVCGGCHGFHGVSEDTATPSLAGQDPTYLAAVIKAYRTTRKHESMQRAVAALNDKEIDNIAAFYSIQKGRPAENGQRLVEELTEKCNRCHGPGIDNPAVAIPKINGQDKNYLMMALRAYRDGRRESSIMHRMSLPYSDTVIDSIASFYAGQPPK